MVLKSAFRPACVAVVAVAIGLMASPGRAAEKSDAKETDKAAVKTVELFAAMESGDIDVKLIPKDSKQSTVLIENKLNSPLRIKLPDAFAGVPVLGQMGGMGGGHGRWHGWHGRHGWRHGMGGGMGGGGGGQGMGGGMGGMGGGMGGMGGGMGGMGGWHGWQAWVAWVASSMSSPAKSESSACPPCASSMVNRIPIRAWLTSWCPLRP